VSEASRPLLDILCNPLWSATGERIGPILILLYTADVLLIAARHGVGAHSQRDTPFGTLLVHVGREPAGILRWGPAGIQAVCRGERSAALHQ